MTTEFKTHEDFLKQARELINKINNADYDEPIATKLASELLDIYKQGWDDRSVIL